MARASVINRTFTASICSGETTRVRNPLSPLEIPGPRPVASSNGKVGGPSISYGSLLYGGPTLGLLKSGKPGAGIVRVPPESSGKPGWPGRVFVMLSALGKEPGLTPGLVPAPLPVEMFASLGLAAC